MVPVSAPVVSVPLVGLVPLHPPEAVQEVASVELQVSVAEPPRAAVVGFAVSVTVGLTVCTTATTTVLCAVPPGPVQVSV